MTVKSSKVISGLEVAKTHELLQAIGRALENKVDSKNAVEEILNKGVRKSGKVCLTFFSSSLPSLFQFKFAWSEIWPFLWMETIVDVDLNV